MIDHTLVSNLIDWLAEHTDEDDLGNRYIKIEREPYHPLAIELQDWGCADDPHKKLFVGYWQKINGDLVADPNIVLRISISFPFEMKATIQNAFGVFEDDGYCNSFLKEILRRVEDKK